MGLYVECYKKSVGRLKAQGFALCEGWKKGKILVGQMVCEEPLSASLPCKDVLVVDVQGHKGEREGWEPFSIAFDDLYLQGLEDLL